MSAGAATTITLHGVFLRIFDLGVLVAGASGVGKSELALELLTRGHRLVADDATDFVFENGRLVGRCPPLLRGFLEVRGLGILNIERLLGAQALAPDCALHMVLRLTLPDEVDEGIDRLHGQGRMRRLLEVEVPEIALPIRLGHNLAALAEAACRNQMLKRDGYDAAEDFVRRQRQAIDNGGG